MMLSAAVIVGTLFGISFLGTARTWIYICSLASVAVLVVALSSGNISRLLLSAAALGAASLGTKLVLAQRHFTLDSLYSALVSFRPVFKWDLTTIAFLWLLRSSLFLTAIEVIRREQMAIARLAFGQIIPDLPSFRPIARLESGPERYLAHDASPLLRSLLAPFLVLAYQSARLLTVIFNQGWRLIYAILIVSRAIIDFVLRILWWFLRMLAHLGRGFIVSLLQTVYDGARALSVSAVSFIFPLALIVVFVRSILALSFFISRFVHSSESEHAVASVFIGIASAIALLVFGRWGVGPSGSVTWWRTGFSQPVPLEVFSPESARNFTFVASSVSNYVLVATGEFFVCFFVNLIFFDFLGTFMHIGPYRFGTTAKVCVSFLILGAILVLVVKKRGQTPRPEFKPG